MRTTAVNVLGFLVVLSSAAFAQSGFYISTSTDGTTVYNTAVFSVEGMQPGYYHNYSLQLTAKSVSGTTVSGGDSQSAPSNQSIEMIAYADASTLPTDPPGDVVVSADMNAYCNVAGHFINNAELTMYLPLQRIQAYYYQSGAPTGKYLVPYARCNPVGSTCDNTSLEFGSNWPQYALFEGIELHVGSSSACVMALEDRVNQCYFPDPIPGVGGGVWAAIRSRPEPSPELRHNDGRQLAIVPQSDRRCRESAVSNAFR